MNKEILAAMRAQLTPSDAAKTALAEKLAAPRRRRWYVPYAAGLAACALLALTPWLVREYKWWEITQSFDPLGTFYKPTHDVIYCEGGTALGQAENTAVDQGEGDRDMVMETEDLVENLTAEDFTQEQIDAYLAEGWVMTWSNWWKYVHNRTVDADWDALLKASQAPVNTGDLPADPVDQGEAVAAYQSLMAWFAREWGNGYPDWYGGAYIDGQGCLIVLIVEEKNPSGNNSKELYLEIQDQAGTDRIGFDEAKFGLGVLRALQMKVVDVMAERGLLAGCGVNEEMNRVELDLTETTAEVLELLYQLDPTNEMILVRVTLLPEEAKRDRLPVGSLDSAPEEDPMGVTVQPGGVPPVEDDGNLIAEEPWYDGGPAAYEPGEERSASETFTPASDTSASENSIGPWPVANSASYAPDAPPRPWQ